MIGLGPRNRRLSTMAAAVVLICLPLVITAAVGPYPDLDVIYSEMRELADSHPDSVSLETIGQSVEGRPILALHAGRRDGEARPEALITANLHAGEVISSQVALGAARRLAQGDGTDPWITALLDRSDFWIVAVANPDGYERVISTGGKGGDGGTRKNAGGVDLNRNFPLAPGAHSNHPLAGNRRPRSSYYMGEEQLSEPESQAIAELASQHRFYGAVNLHSVAGKFLYPHCYTKKPAAHLEDFERMGAAFANRQGPDQYKVENSYGWYPTLGDLDDFLYIQHGVLSVTVEHGRVSRNLAYALVHRPLVFWVMNPSDPGHWVKNDADAVLAALAEALEITGGEPCRPDQVRPPSP